MSQHDEDDTPLTPDEILSALTGMCTHQIQLQRVTGLLGLVAKASPGGRLRLDLKALTEMDGGALSLDMSEPGFAVVEWVDEMPDDLGQLASAVPPTASKH